MTTVAVLGTGTMGAGMARSLLRAGLTVRAWNRSADKAHPLAADGASIHPTSPEAVEGADVVVLMLFDRPAVLQVLADIAGSLGGSAVVLQTSTIGPDGTAEVADLAARHGVKLLDAPVLGTKQPAEDGKLVVLASGDPALRAAVAPVLDSIGSRTVWVGDTVGLASTLKLACNSWVASVTAAAGQAIALARGAGLDPQLVLEAIGGGPVDMPYLGVKGTMMIDGKFDPPSFALDGVRKDLDLMLAMATANGVQTGLLSAVHARFDAAADLGHGGDDMAAVVKGF